MYVIISGSYFLLQSMPHISLLASDLISALQCATGQGPSCGMQRPVIGSAFCPGTESP